MKNQSKTSTAAPSVIDFKLHKSVATELKDIYEYHLFEGSPSAHEALLAAHLSDMHQRLKSMIDKMKVSAKLAFSKSEAIAFTQWWSLTDTTPWPIANVIIADMVKKISANVAFGWNMETSEITELRRENQELRTAYERVIKQKNEYAIQLGKTGVRNVVISIC